MPFVGPQNRPHRLRPGRAAWCAGFLAGLVAGCSAPAPATSPDPGDGAPSAAELRRTAVAALTGPGNVTVSDRDGAVVVTGNLESATDERRVVRALGRLDGVASVESHVQREM